MAAGAGDSTDWKALFCSLIDKTISGDVVIPSTVDTTKIAPYEFENCSNLESIVLPPQITTISANAFNKCGNITSITKSDNSGILVVDGRAFGECKKLVEIPPLAEGMTVISNWAFISCTALTSVDLPSTITAINAQAFFACSSLAYIIVRATTPPTLGANALPNQLGLIYVPDASVAAYKATTRWSDFAAKIKPLSELTT